MEDSGGERRLEGMSDERDERKPEQEDVEAHAAEVEDEPDDDSDVEGHLFQRR